MRSSNLTFFKAKKTELTRLEINNNQIVLELSKGILKSANLKRLL